MKPYFLSVFAIGVMALAAPASASPEVEVEVVDEDSDDLFAPRPAAPANDGVRARAADAFEALEREEAKHGKGSKKRVRVSASGDVAEVEVVVEDEDPLMAPAAPEAPATSEAPAAPAAPAAPVAPAVPAAPVTTSAPPPPPSVRTTPQRAWWDRPSYVQEGDLVLWLSGGSFDAGGFGGIGGEGMASDTIGIRFSGMFGSFGHTQPGSGFSPNFDVFEGGLWAIQRDVNPDTARGGFVHLTELSVTAHLTDKSMFDPYTTLGLAHFGYEVEFRDGTERGGAAYTRLGAGANVHFSRFFAGLDFGWYPIELFRYTVEEKSKDGYEGKFEDVNNRFETERFTLTAQVGLRF